MGLFFAAILLGWFEKSGLFFPLWFSLEREIICVWQFERAISLFPVGGLGGVFLVFVLVGLV